MAVDIDTSRWNALYPNYIDSKKKVFEGRRIGLEKAVEQPHAAEMAEICQYLKIPHLLEMDKYYPRDWMIGGRVRVMLKTPEGAFTHPEIHNKKQLMLKMGELIPKLPSRAKGPPPQAIRGAASCMTAGAAAAAAAASSSAGSGAAGAGAGGSKAERKEAKREEKKAQKKKGK
mmetsp:Transcript_32939/g.49866  ORF Transcript_32939/g.49866 Transcript_32939/m.49866 type:complete len:173 (+) Transcript_32939:53-571(+)|eukprot:CAMPEP_0206470296 /NCGR_PEP_ID=MMETSP0324_2-20121206/30844_1 /ASSEMBLY_ACC=CAM_ASM_000836 /TAXON_ID=2866 /ORGANISM="Crypthecodinium cohnii, Strain Seligo" /LENGTH=172 /DNA_ID=CAMNT_0053944325 /DNA_START=66 /DNA_END=584 /DNA_ORIENTATION=+